MSKIWPWIVARLSEKTTWAGLVAAGGLVGLTLAPETWKIVEGFALALIALVAVITKEKK